MGVTGGRGPGHVSVGEDHGDGDDDEPAEADEQRQHLVKALGEGAIEQDADASVAG